MYHTPHLCEISEIVFQIADAWVGTEYHPSQKTTGYELQEELQGGKAQGGRVGANTAAPRAREGQDMVGVLYLC